MKEKLSVGSYFIIVAAVLSVVGIVMYGNVMYTQTNVYGFLIATIVVAVLGIVLSFLKLPVPVYEAVPVVNAVLSAFAAVFGVSLMVNQIGYVIAGLDGMETLNGLIYYEVVMVIALLVNIIAAFLPMKKAA